ncbi:hypothetical protein KZ483_17220 [Paenibacillus sp. sptzw28]|uniref:hypothetical protein n=1 Tax=Paenibacillus sp. sptzw28 TaxID=715179 RepID=UPI001C6E9C50|nr:hypothetical protein [Paenibacillus sp. sptzw28]QYR19634.1 hypothetical protein KZ483_17220 [Paenibacillus sp. sptzw28]
MMFNLNGEVEDDVLQFDRFSKETIREGTIKVKIILNAINEGLGMNTIARIIEIDEELIRPFFES